MKLEVDKSLLSLNTFRVNVSAKLFTEVHTPEDFLELIRDEKLRGEKKLILGGGSNILFRGNVNGLVVKNSIHGIEVLREDAYHTLIKVASGEIWHDFVMFCVERNLSGIENLSLIPGLVGAAPMQNIGAYGAELQETCELVECIHVSSGEVKTFTNGECRFGYRDSIFKNEAQDQFMITSVTFRLSKVFRPKINYGDIRKTLEEMRTDEITIKAVSNAVIRIRTSKLPDLKDIPNAGSFFKNPVVSKKKFKELTERYPLIPNYPAGARVKLPAGWLIEQCGWKGKRVGNTGVHSRQALILVNYGDASGEEIFTLGEQIRQSVSEKFGVDLETEVNIIADVK